MAVHAAQLVTSRRNILVCSPASSAGRARPALRRRAQWLWAGTIVLFAWACSAPADTDAELPGAPSSPTAAGEQLEPAEPVLPMGPEPPVTPVPMVPTPPPAAPVASCDPIEFTVETPVQPKDYVVAVSLEEDDVVGNERAVEFIELVANSMREPNNRDVLNLYLPPFFDVASLLEDLDSRVHLVQQQIYPDRPEDELDAIDWAFGDSGLSLVVAKRPPLRPDSSIQVVSFRTGERDDLFCWVPTVRMPVCDLTADRETIAVDRLDDVATVGWQAHLLKPESCDDGSNPTPVFDGLVQRSEGIAADYCTPGAMADFFATIHAQLRSAPTSCSVPIADSASEVGFDAAQVSVFEEAEPGLEPTELTYGATECDGFSLDRSLDPTSIALCPSACGGPPRSIEVSVQCDSSCERLSAAADVRSDALDLVLGIDVSGSMSEETELVQRNLDAFTRIVRDSGVDLKLIVLANHRIPPPVSAESSDQFVSLDIEIQSRDGLNVLLDSYPRYSLHMRTGAATHYLLITDDDTSRYDNPLMEGPNPPDIPEVPDFVDQMTARLGQTFVYHSIASPGIDLEPCSGDHGKATRPGAAQLELAQATGGTQQSICSQNWAPLFQSLAESLLETIPLSCEFDLPIPPDGASYAFDSVDIQLAAMGDPTVYTLARFPDAASCGSVGGWHFDNAEQPSSIQLCPGACEFVGAARLPAIQVSLDCEIEQPIPLPPVAK